VKLPGITYDSNRSFSLWQRVQLLVLPPVIAGVMRLLFSTCRLEIRGKEHVDQVIEEHGHTLMAIWHESIPVACWANSGRNYHTLTSHSFDGEMAARVARHFGIEAVRGSSSGGGAEGLRQMQLAAQQVGWVGFTLDGPRGPRRVAKPGIGILAARTRLPVIPLAIVPLRAKRMRSWDRLPIPYPFSRVISAFGKPIPPPPTDSKEGVEQTRIRVEQGLNRLYETIEAEFGITP
jgi:lysophospholipid acyltransferase (LPLAT)-like uncharacterized protein